MKNNKKTLKVCKVCKIKFKHYFEHFTDDMCPKCWLDSFKVKQMKGGN